jgi:hypothetical protein
MIYQLYNYIYNMKYISTYVIYHNNLNNKMRHIQLKHKSQIWNENNSLIYTYDIIEKLGGCDYIMYIYSTFKDKII